MQFFMNHLVFRCLPTSPTPPNLIKSEASTARKEGHRRGKTEGEEANYQQTSHTPSMLPIRQGENIALI